MKSWRIKLRIVLWLILVIFVGWLLYKGVVPSGKISYSYDFSKAKVEQDSWFIQKLTPEERVELSDKAPAKIFGDPVYFALRTPRRFNKAKLTLKYRHGRRDLQISPSMTPIIEAGVLVDKIIWRYDLQPIENKIIDELSKTWQVIKDKGVMLLQRKELEETKSLSERLSLFSSIDEFSLNLPARNEIALYNYQLDQEFLLADYQAEELSSGYPELSSVPALRGPWQFYTYINNEILDFQFSLEDINKNKDSDPVDLQVYYRGELIDSQHLADDGIAEDNNQVSQEREMELKLANLPEGAYKIELRANDDIVTKKIITKQSKLAFINRLWLLDSSDNEIELYTDSRLINAQTINPGSLQTIKIFGPLTSSLPPLELKLGETYKQFSATTLGDENLLVIAKDDVIIAGDGVFSIDAKSMINPQFKKVTAGFDADKQGINYILTKYNTPIEADGWQVAQAEFDLSRAYREFYKYNFIISIPGLKADDDIDDYIEISEIKIDLEGTTLLEKINKLFR